MKSLKIVIPLPPRTKKNHSRIITLRNGRKMLRPSKQYEQFEAECVAFLLKYRDLKIDYPINLKCIFYKDKNYNSDLVGYIQAIQDILVKYGILADDNDKIIVSLDGSRCYIDKVNPRIEIEIVGIK